MGNVFETKVVKKLASFLLQIMFTGERGGFLALMHIF